MKNAFRGLFGRKKNDGGKENQSPEMSREPSSRQSQRGASGRGSVLKARMASMEDLTERGGRLRDTACYQTVNPPKLHRGPKSCPGAYKGEECELEGGDQFDKSFGGHLEAHGSYRGDRRRERDREYRQSTRESKRGSRYESTSASGHSSSLKHHPRRWGPTSEYGSADPSPIERSSRSAYVVDDSEDTDGSVRFYNTSEQNHKLHEQVLCLRQEVSNLYDRKNHYKALYSQIKAELTKKDDLIQTLQKALDNNQDQNEKFKKRIEELEKKLEKKTLTDQFNNNQQMQRYQQQQQQAHQRSFYQNTMQQAGNMNMYNVPPFEPNYDPFNAASAQSFNPNMSFNLAPTHRNVLSMPPNYQLNVTGTPSSYAHDAGAGESLTAPHNISRSQLPPIITNLRNPSSLSVHTPQPPNGSFDEFSTDEHRDGLAIDTDLSHLSLDEKARCDDDVNKTLPDKLCDEKELAKGEDEELSLVSSTRTAKEE